MTQTEQIKGTEMTDEKKDAMPDDFTLDALPYPVEWEVICPSCERCYGIPHLTEDFAGFYSPDDQDQFHLCECGCNIHITAAQITRAQSHAQEASPVDADQLKRPVEFNRQGNQIINLYNDGYNDAIDELLRRGFRQGENNA